MSKISLSPNASGTGTFTIASPNSNTDRTLTLPDATGTLVLTATPTFTGQATIPTINLTGGQITFPATQSASSDANTLDDYEEGTWTPLIQGGSTAGTTTYSQQHGWYTKVGNLVTIGFYVNWSSATGTGALHIAGLPFASAGGSNYTAGGLMTGNSLDWPASRTMATLYKPPGNSIFEIYCSGDNLGWEQQTMDSAAELIGGCTYRV